MGSLPRLIPAPQAVLTHLNNQRATTTTLSLQQRIEIKKQELGFGSRKTSSATAGSSLMSAVENERPSPTFESIKPLIRSILDDLQSDIDSQIFRIRDDIEELGARQDRAHQELQEEMSTVETAALGDINRLDARVNNLQELIAQHEERMARQDKERDAILGVTSSPPPLIPISSQTAGQTFSVESRTVNNSQFHVTFERPQVVVPTPSSGARTVRSRGRISKSGKAQVECDFCFRKMQRGYLSKHKRMHCDVARLINSATSTDTEPPIIENVVTLSGVSFS